MEDRGAEADAGDKHEVERRHVVRKRSAGGGARLRTDESRPAEGTSTSVFRGEDAVANFADSVSNLPEPIQGKVALHNTTLVVPVNPFSSPHLSSPRPPHSPVKELQAPWMTMRRSPQRITNRGALPRREGHNLGRSGANAPCWKFNHLLTQSALIIKNLKMEHTKKKDHARSARSTAEHLSFQTSCSEPAVTPSANVSLVETSPSIHNFGIDDEAIRSASQGLAPRSKGMASEESTYERTCHAIETKPSRR